jgi:hypothetical protein
VQREFSNYDESKIRNVFLLDKAAW